MKGINSNLSSLFGSLRKDTLFGNFNFSDYASIKNGSYSKAVKSYYQETSSKDKATEVDKKTSVSAKKDFKDTTGLSQMRKEADGLKAATEALGKEELWSLADGGFNKEKIAGALKDFVKEYNDVLTQAGKVNSKEVSQSAGYMKSLTDTMSKSLSKAGITVESDGKLSLNEDTLGKANMTSVKSLFTGKVSYGSQTADKAADIAKAAVNGSSLYTGSGALSSSIPGLFDKFI